MYLMTLKDLYYGCSFGYAVKRLKRKDVKYTIMNFGGVQKLPDLIYSLLLSETDIGI